MKWTLQIYLSRGEKWFKLWPAHHGSVTSLCIKNRISCARENAEDSRNGQRDRFDKERNSSGQCLDYTTELLLFILSYLPKKYWSILSVTNKRRADNTKLICIVSHWLETALPWLCILHASVTDRNNWRKLVYLLSRLCTSSNVSLLISIHCRCPLTYRTLVFFPKYT